MTKIHIVAGGPSLKTFDWRSLDREVVLAINNAAFKLPGAKYVYFADLDWFNRWEVDLMLHHGCVIQGVDNHNDQWCRRDWVQRWNFVPGDVFATKPFELRPGGHSGHAAVNLAVTLGYRSLVLHGYDFLDGDDTGSFHGTHPHNTHQPAEWRECWPRVAAKLAELGVEVERGHR